MRNSIYLHTTYLIIFMNLDRENLFQNGLFLNDFMNGWMDKLDKVNIEYVSFYVYMFLRIVSHRHKFEW